MRRKKRQEKKLNDRSAQRYFVQPLIIKRINESESHPVNGD